MPSRSLAPDLILTGGTVHTIDQNGAKFDALAIKDGRFVGSVPTKRCARSRDRPPWKSRSMEKLSSRV